MLLCDRCARANPPTRAQCIYCGNRLEFPGSDGLAISHGTPALQPLEEGEQGYNCILLGDEDFRLGESDIARISALIRLEPNVCRSIIESGVPLPVARIPEMEGAEAIKRRLGQMGLSSLIVADRDLLVESFPQKRARSLEVNAKQIVISDLGNKDALSVAWEEIILLVSGRLVARRVEQKERHERGAKRLVESQETSSDEDVLDVYAESLQNSWRISARSFDFSFLGKEMGLLAGENLSRVVSTFLDRAVNAEHDDSYIRSRKALSTVWPVEERKEAGGWQRAGAGKFNTAAVNVSNNETQFSRYSRLRHYLRLRRVRGNAP